MSNQLLLRGFLSSCKMLVNDMPKMRIRKTLIKQVQSFQPSLEAIQNDPFYKRVATISLEVLDELVEFTELFNAAEVEFSELERRASVTIAKIQEIDKLTKQLEVIFGGIFFNGPSKAHR